MYIHKAIKLLFYLETKCVGTTHGKGFKMTFESSYKEKTTET